MKEKMQTFYMSLVVFVYVSFLIAPMAEATGEAKVHIIYTEKPPSDVLPKAYHLRTLSSVLGSEEAAKKAMIYSYNAIPGFSAMLTPEQVALISKQPGVLYVAPSRTYHLDKPGGGVGF